MITEKMRKKEFVRNISTVLAEDPRSGVEYIEYDGDFPGGRRSRDYTPLAKGQSPGST